MDELTRYIQGAIATRTGRQPSEIEATAVAAQVVCDPLAKEALAALNQVIDSELEALVKVTPTSKIRIPRHIPHWALKPGTLEGASHLGDNN